MLLLHATPGTHPEPSQRDLARGWLDNGLAQRARGSQPGSLQTHGLMPHSACDGCKDLGWLRAAPGQLQCQAGQIAGRGGWAQQTQGAGCSPRCCSPHPVAFKSN